MNRSADGGTQVKRRPRAEPDAQRPRGRRDRARASCLLAGAGLMMRSFLRMEEQRSGIDRARRAHLAASRSRSRSTKRSPIAAPSTSDSCRASRPCRVSCRPAPSPTCRSGNSSWSRTVQVEGTHKETADLPRRDLRRHHSRTFFATLRIPVPRGARFLPPRTTRGAAGRDREPLRRATCCGRGRIRSASALQLRVPRHRRMALRWSAWSRDVRRVGALQGRGRPGVRATRAVPDPDHVPPDPRRGSPGARSPSRCAGCSSRATRTLPFYEVAHHGRVGAHRGLGAQALRRADGRLRADRARDRRGRDLRRDGLQRRPAHPGDRDPHGDGRRGGGCCAW